MTYTPAFLPEYAQSLDLLERIAILERENAMLAAERDRFQRALVEVQSKTALYIVDITQERDKWRKRALQAENDITQIRAELANVELITRKYARR